MTSSASKKRAELLLKLMFIDLFDHFYFSAVPIKTINRLSITHGMAFKWKLLALQKCNHPFEKDQKLYIQLWNILQNDILLNNTNTVCNISHSVIVITGVNLRCKISAFTWSTENTLDKIWLKWLSIETSCNNISVQIIIISHFKICELNITLYIPNMTWLLHVLIQYISCSY